MKTNKITAQTNALNNEIKAFEKACKIESKSLCNFSRIILETLQADPTAYPHLLKAVSSVIDVTKPLTAELIKDFAKMLYKGLPQVDRTPIVWTKKRGNALTFETFAEEFTATTANIMKPTTFQKWGKTLPKSEDSAPANLFCLSMEKEEQRESENQTKIGETWYYVSFMNGIPTLKKTENSKHVTENVTAIYYAMKKETYNITDALNALRVVADFASLKDAAKAADKLATAQNADKVGGKKASKKATENKEEKKVIEKVDKKNNKKNNKKNK